MALIGVRVDWAVATDDRGFRLSRPAKAAFASIPSGGPGASYFPPEFGERMDKRNQAGCRNGDADERRRPAGPRSRPQGRFVRRSAPIWALAVPRRNGEIVIKGGSTVWIASISAEGSRHREIGPSNRSLNGRPLPGRTAPHGSPGDMQACKQDDGTSSSADRGAGRLTKPPVERGVPRIQAKY